MKRTPLARTGWLERRTPVRRVSARRQVSHATLTKLCRYLVVDLRDKNTCQRCGLVHRCMEWAHVVTRNAFSITFVPWNSLALGGPRINQASCHGWFDNNKEAGLAWWRETFPERALLLDMWRQLRGPRRPKIDREAERLWLEQEIAMMEGR